MFTPMFTFENLDRPGSRVGRRVHKAVSRPFPHIDERLAVICHHCPAPLTKSTTIFVKKNVKSTNFLKLSGANRETTGEVRANVTLVLQ